MGGGGEMARKYYGYGVNSRRRETRADKLFDSVIGDVVLWGILSVIVIVCIVA